MKAAKLVLGIVAIVMGACLFISGSGVLILSAAFILAGGIVGLCARKSAAGGYTAAGLLFAAGLFCLIHSSDAIGGVSICFAIGAVFLIGSFYMDKNKPAEMVTVLWLVFFFPVGLYYMWAKTKWSSVSKILITVLLSTLLVAIAFIARSTPPANIGQTQDTSSSDSSTSATTDIASESTDNAVPAETDSLIIEITAEELFEAFDNNEVAANRDYKGKEIKVTGIITEIGTDAWGNAYVALETNDLFRDVKCYFDSDMLDAVAELSKHQTVTLTGVCKGLSADVLIRECKIVYVVR